MSDLIKLQDRAMEIRRRYVELEKKRDGKTRDAVAMAQGFKRDVTNLIDLLASKNFDQRQLNDELADCLWSVLVIARKLDVDIERAFWTTMLELDNRLDKDLK